MKQKFSGREPVDLINQGGGALPAPALLADSTANPTVPGTSSFMMMWNGTFWDRVFAQIVNGDALAANNRGFQVVDYGFSFNGATWDRKRNNVEATIFASAVQTATVASPDQTNFDARGVLLILNITAGSGTTPTLDVKVQYKDPVTGNYIDIPSAAFAQKTTIGTDTLLIYPGITSTANRQISTVLSRTWRVVATIGGTTPSFTFSLGASYVL